LEHFDPETISDFNEFLDYVAKARIVQELEENLIARAISKLLSDE